jgi:hypothetical protein
MVYAEVENGLHKGERVVIGSTGCPTWRIATACTEAGLSDEAGDALKPCDPLSEKYLYRPPP